MLTILAIATWNTLLANQGAVVAKIVW